jgi:1,4-dihydroxy-2-naphthoyl-CoA hydrolase
MKKIWKVEDATLDSLNEMSTQTMASWMGMRFTDIGDDYLEMKMPVDERTHQPYGLLHGGASAALAETIGSVASSLCIDREKQICVGIEINCNHVRGKRSGTVTATARPLHLGSTSHVWDIRIEDEEQRLICISRLTVAVLQKKGKE